MQTPTSMSTPNSVERVTEGSDTYLRVVVSAPKGEWRPFKCSLEDAPLLEGTTWHMTSEGYIRGSRDGKKGFFHRLAINAPKGESVDHMNNNRADNRRSNLRLASAQMQSINRCSKAGKDLPPGIHFDEVTNKYVTTRMTADGPRSAVYATGEHGHDCALHAALYTRMDTICASDANLESLCFIPEINVALKECGLPDLPAKPTLQVMRAAMYSLRAMRYNMWKIPHHGKYASFGETPEWTAKTGASRCIYILQHLLTEMVADVPCDHIRESLEKLESDLLSLCERHSPSGSRIVVPQPSEVAPPLTSAEAIKVGVDLSTRPARSAKDAREVSLAAASADPQSELDMVRSEFNELLSTCKTPDEARAMIKGATKIGNSIKKLRKPPSTTEKRVMTISQIPSVIEWIAHHIIASPNHVLDIHVAYSAYCEWCASTSQAVIATQTQFTRLMKAASYPSKSVTVYLNVDMV